MTVDRVRVEARLEHLVDATTKLKRLAAIEAGEFYGDFRNVESTAHLLQTAIQAMLDIGSHVLSRSGLPRPETNVGVVDGLLSLGVLDRGRAASYSQMAALRNLLVHEYVRVAPSELRRILQDDLGDLDALAAEVATWLETEAP